MDQETEDELREMAERLRSLPKPERLVALEAIEASEVPLTEDQIWKEFARFSGGNSKHLTTELRRCVAEMIYRLRFPESKKNREARAAYFQQLQEFAELTDKFLRMYHTVAKSDLHPRHGFDSLWERFAFSNENFITPARRKEQNGARSKIALEEFDGLLELFRIATFRHADAFVFPLKPGRPEFPEREECAELAVIAWLRSQWFIGKRGTDLLPTKRNNGRRFICQLLELGFRDKPLSSKRVEDIAKGASKNLRDQALSVSSFIENDIASGRDTQLSKLGFHVRPYPAYIRYRAAIGDPIPD